jgi:hypothetical protein
MYKESVAEQLSSRANGTTSGTFLIYFCTVQRGKLENIIVLQCNVAAYLYFT